MNYEAIEHRAPRKGDTYIDGRQIVVATVDHLEERDVLIPTHPWPDKRGIVIDHGLWCGKPILGPILAIRINDGSYIDERKRLWNNKNNDTITAWHEYIPDGYTHEETR